MQQYKGSGVYMNETNKNRLLMTMGVVEIENDIRSLGADPLEYNRKPEYGLFLKEIFENLQYIHQTQHPVFLVASSGTGVMEGALTNVLSQNDTALFVNGGTFGERWGKICDCHNIKTIELKKDYGVPPTAQEIKDALEKNPEIKAVLITHNETSIGTLTDIKAIADVVKQYPKTILVVDCISSLLVEEIKTDEWGLDVVVSSCNKALAVPPGIGFFTISKKAMEFVEKAKNRLFNFDAIEYNKEWLRNSTPYTPPISLLKQLHARLNKIKKEGLDNVRARYKHNTQYLRDGIEKLGLTFYTKLQANCVSYVVTPDGIDAMDVINIMSNKHKIDITPSWPDLRSKVFRVGNFGNINKPEIDRFLNALDNTLKELGSKE